MQAEQRKTINDLKPDDIVKVCPYLQMACCFQLDGLHSCCLGTVMAPVLVTAEEIRNKVVTYDLIVERRKQLFAAINDLADGPTGNCKNCIWLKEVPYKDVNFEYMGGQVLGASFNIQHYTSCNEKCTYCCYAQEGNLIPPQYDILEVFELFRERGKLRGGNFVDFSGGEPALLKDFEKILTYLTDNNFGQIGVYTNGTVFSQKFYDLLKENKVYLMTSIDTGLCSTYKKVRGINALPVVLNNLIKYRNSGTKNLWLKYVVTDDNRTDDDMWAFIMTMLALRPNIVKFCPQFPYGDKEIPEESIDFIAKLVHNLIKYTGKMPRDYTLEFGDPKFVRYRESLATKLNELNAKDPIDDSTVLDSWREPCEQHVESVTPPEPTLYPIKPPTFLQKIFSIRNEYNRKVVRILGFKIKFKRK